MNLARFPYELLFIIISFLYGKSHVRLVNKRFRRIYDDMVIDGIQNKGFDIRKHFYMDLSKVKLNDHPRFGHLWKMHGETLLEAFNLVYLIKNKYNEYQKDVDQLYETPTRAMKDKWCYHLLLYHRNRYYIGAKIDIVTQTQTLKWVLGLNLHCSVIHIVRGVIEADDNRDWIVKLITTLPTTCYHGLYQEKLCSSYNLERYTDGLAHERRYGNHRKCLVNPTPRDDFDPMTCQLSKK